MPAQLNEAPSIAVLLASVEAGETGAFDRLVDVLYPDLKRLAHFQLRLERRDHTLNTTEIVHEAFLRLSVGERSWNDRRHLLRAAAKVMRHLLVDHARRKQADKRHVGMAMVTWHDDLLAEDDDPLSILALDAALEQIAELDPLLESLIECRCFAGLSVQETADALGLTKRTAEREWARARAHIAAALEP